MAIKSQVIYGLLDKHHNSYCGFFSTYEYANDARNLLLAEDYDQDNLIITEEELDLLFV
jgi:hypothetical protein